MDKSEPQPEAADELVDKSEPQPEADAEDDQDVGAGGRRRRRRRGKGRASKEHEVVETTFHESYFDFQELPEEIVDPEGNFLFDQFCAQSLQQQGDEELQENQSGVAAELSVWEHKERELNNNHESHGFQTGQSIAAMPDHQEEQYHECDAEPDSTFLTEQAQDLDATCQQTVDRRTRASGDTCGPTQNGDCTDIGASVKNSMAGAVWTPSLRVGCEPIAADATEEPQRVVASRKPRASARQPYVAPNGGVRSTARGGCEAGAAEPAEETHWAVPSRKIRASAHQPVVHPAAAPTGGGLHSRMPADANNLATIADDSAPVGLTAAVRVGVVTNSETVGWRPMLRGRVSQ